MPASRQPQGECPGSRPSPCSGQQGAVRASSPCLFCTEGKCTGQATDIACPFILGTIKRVHQSRKMGCHVDMRELKGLEIAARSKVTFEAGAWVVPSQSGNGKYRVTIGADPSCTCDDLQLRQQPCKHIH